MITIVVLRRREARRIARARKKGLWPPEDEPPTMEHVKRLAQAKDINLAIKLYRQIHRGSLAKAKKAVEKLAG
jgi:hypothetical protein